MEDILYYFDLELICLIVNHGQARKITSYAREIGVTGSTVCLGKGTVKPNKFLEFFDLAESEREIILMIVDSVTSSRVMPMLNEKFKFYKRNHGIAFSVPVNDIVGSTAVPRSHTSGGKKMSGYKVIFTIVDKGNAELVIDAARKAGSKGGTIINARGSGIHETEKFFNMEFSPEKEIVLMLAEETIIEGIVSSIKKEINIDDPGNGIIFIQDVHRTYGLVDQKN